MNYVRSFWTGSQTCERDEELVQTREFFKTQNASFGVEFEEGESCGDCGRIKEQARRLDCGHAAFCDQCLQKIAPLGIVICLCGDKIDLGNRTIADLPLHVKGTRSFPPGLEALEFHKLVDDQSLPVVVGSLDDIQLEDSTTCDTNEFVMINSQREDNSLSQVEHYIGFVLGPQQAELKVTEWLTSHWFAPGDFQEKLVRSKLQQLFVPFFVCSVTTRTDYVASISQPTSLVSGNYIRNLTPGASTSEKSKAVEGAVTTNHKQILLSGSLSINQKLMNELLKSEGSFSKNTSHAIPTDLRKFNEEDFGNDPNAKVMKIELSQTEVWEQIQEELKISELDQCRTLLRQQHSKSHVHNVDAYVQFMNQACHVVLLPVYTTIYEYNQVQCEIIVSGFNGKVVGTRPSYGMGSVARLTKAALNRVGYGPKSD